MFCPDCGNQEREAHQFCRACGCELRSRKSAALAADGTVASAARAREAIGRAVATKIGDLKTAKELTKVVEEVLPKVEKFLESPEERRLRRLRAGLVMQAIGIGATIFFTFFFERTEEGFQAGGLGIVLFLLGLAIFLNGRYLTVPSSSRRDEEEASRLRDALDLPRLDTGRLAPASDAYLAPPPSVVENTTRELRDVQSARQARTTSD